MNQQQIALRLALSDAGLPLSTAQFEERLIIQKVVFLLQKAGVHLGYRFRWYLRGPYSPELTSDAFSVAGVSSEAEEIRRSWQLDDKSRNRIARLTRMWSSKKTLQERARWLELVASVLFLVDQKPERIHDPAGLRKTLRRFNKIFSEDEIQTSIDTLRRHSLA